jgi:hypothetical protein
MSMKHAVMAGAVMLAASAVAFGGTCRRHHQRQGDLRRNTGQDEAD